MLPGYSLEPKPNMPDLAAILVFHGTAGSIITIGFVTKRTLALEKPVWREKTRLTNPEAWAKGGSARRVKDHVTENNLEDGEIGK